jgi:hypothetical protein
MEEKLAVLHDHYKETFQLIREREKQRDQLFFYIISLVGALFLSTQYPSFIPTIVELSQGDAKLNLAAIPVAVISSVFWMILFAVSLRYCSYTVLIDRQYSYLHTLEDKISPLLGDTDIYRREGKVYNDNYPAVSWWVWFVYTLVFPTLLVVSVIALLPVEWKNAGLLPGHRFFDTICGTATIVTFLLYKFVPQAIKAYQRVKQWFSKTSQHDVSQ